jgi:hypothetical protein
MDGPITIILTNRNAANERSTNGLKPMADRGITTYVISRWTATPYAVPQISARSIPACRLRVVGVAAEYDCVRVGTENKFALTRVS